MLKPEYLKKYEAQLDENEVKCATTKPWENVVVTNDGQRRRANNAESIY